MNDVSYWQKLKDPRWQKKRLEIFTRDNFTCLNCESKDKTLHVHHTAYVKGLEPWEYSQSLITLCEPCHQERSDCEKSLLIAFSRLKNHELISLAKIVGGLSGLQCCDQFPTLIGPVEEDFQESNGEKPQ